MIRGYASAVPSAQVARRLHLLEMVAHQEILHEGGRGQELGRRMMVAVIAVPMVAGIVALGRGPSALLFGAAAAVGCSEYYRLALGSISTACWIGIAAALLMPLAPAFLPAGSAAPALFGILAAVSLLTWTTHLFAGPHVTAPERAGHVVAGLLFSSVGLVALSVLPGHGGMLDRIDGVLFVAPMVWLARVTFFPH
jgi:CDP-diglyceride synthetase